MFTSYNSNKIFNEFDLSASLQGYLDAVKKEISGQEDLRCDNDDEFVKEIVEKHSVKTISLDTQNIQAEIKKAEIPSNYFPRMFDVDRGDSYEKNVAVFSIPYSGDQDLLKARPSSRLMWTQEVEISSDKIAFEIILFQEDADALKAGRDEIVSKIVQQLQNVNGEVERFNHSLSEAIKVHLQQECKKRSSTNDLLSKLNS